MKIVHDNITNATEQFIIHGCNAQGVMGSGIALALRNKWPHIFQPYVQHLKTFPSRPVAVGSHHFVEVGPNKWVINAITQCNYGKDGRKYADPEAIRKILHNVAWGFTTLKAPPTIASSKIGCGLGGLDWEDVKKIYEEVEVGHGIEFTIYDSRSALSDMGRDVSEVF